EDGGGDGDAEDAEGELVEALGAREDDGGAVVEGVGNAEDRGPEPDGPHGDEAVQEGVDLEGAHADEGGEETLEHRADAGLGGGRVVQPGGVAAEEAEEPEALGDAGGDDGRA